MPHDRAVGGFRLRWDVFLSFRGEDTRHTITASIYDALVRHGVRVFRDDDALGRGDEIAPSLLDAIDDSAAAVVVLSPKYADSKWCLEELAKICDGGGRRLILPVFYHVDPSDVRKQRGPFENDFNSHEKRFESSKVCEWRKAMAKVGGIAGFVVHSSKEAELIQSLIKTVLAEINRTPVGLAAFTVGLDSRIEDVMRLLDVKTSDVRVVGVHGMGGVGKTTLATAIFNKLVGRFEGHCFVPNFREDSAGQKGLMSLQNKLIGSLSSGTMPVNDIEAGISMIKALVYDKRVLVVLDDVDNVDQLQGLIGKGQWFGEGSRIIITTRDKGILPSHLVNYMLYEVRELHESQALNLFSYHALRRDKPTESFLNLSKEIVFLTGGLPLALEVFGSFLFDKRRIEEWTDALQKLKRVRPRHLQDVLKISYDALEEQEKCIFLDIACLLITLNPKKEDAIDVMRSCGFEGEIAIAELTAKSLIKIREDSTLWMHDQVRDMGRQIVRHGNVLNPGMCSRLWEHAEIINVFKHDKGTKCMQGIVLEDLHTNWESRRPRDLTGDKISWNNFLSCPSFTSATTYTKEYLKEWYKVHLQNQAEKESRITIHTKPFEAMVNLRLLLMNHVNLEGSFKFLPSQLKWLQWKGCPLKSLPSVLFHRELAGLDLSDSKKVERLFSSNKNKVAEKLMFLNLSGCSSLTAIPDLSGNHALEKLVLKHCVGLIKLHDSIGNLNTLVYLNLEGCKNLAELPSDVSGLRKLDNLNLDGCCQLKRLPKNIGSMVSLKEFVLDGTSIESLPETIFHLMKLERLSLNRCSALKGLPEEIGKLCSLKEISLNGSGLEKLPDSIGFLANLEKLSLFWCRSLTTIPDCLDNLNSLMELFTNGTPIEELPLSFGSLSNLKELSVGHGQFLQALPASVAGLHSLVVLKIDETSITCLPQEIGALKALEKLELRKCKFLRSLPESIGSMMALTSIIITAADITDLPESIGKLENLTMLRLNECKQFRKLPTSIGQLKSLHQLQMRETAVRELPESFGMLSGLMVLSMGKKPEIGKHIEEKFILPASFSKLSLLYELEARACNISGELSDDIEKLSSLETLNLSRNSFCRLPASLVGMSVLQTLKLPHCRNLKSIPPLPISLKEVDIANCIALESISDVSNLENLTELNLTNCEKVEDIPGIECLNSFTNFYMGGCKTCSSVVKKRLAKKSHLRRIHGLSMPGSKIPDWFSQDVITFSERKKHVIKHLIIGVVVSLDQQTPDDLREELPAVVDIQAKILKLNSPIFTSALYLLGVAKTNEDQFYLCKYPRNHPLVSQLKEGYTIHVERREPPLMKGVELKKWGIHMVYEGDDEYEGDEESLKENHQSLSEKLARFFDSFDEEEAGSTSTSSIEQDDRISATEAKHSEDEPMSTALEIRGSERRVGLPDRRYFVYFFIVLSLVVLSLSWVIFAALKS